eukprot:Gregarina_sp_Poly_1__322@NODE_1079_length_5165_cov_34_784033_g750_i0_p9_GENE_NODE_1079_length_5165_cov_34_784033_g750_i0NODE_1079_length_5165_cov_34_784033_g750_i0_p9_ORF_typecomplete_len106_score4_18DNA_pol3_gamma3/PF12169_8/0_088_NODE_1079_length_5165_cov_34_784033_g750_i017572074
MVGFILGSLLLSTALATCQTVNKQTLTRTLADAFQGDIPLAMEVARHLFSTNSDTTVCLDRLTQHTSDISVMYPVYANTKRRVLSDPTDVNKRNYDVIKMVRMHL